MASPAFSRSSSRRSSIGNAEDHINSRFINRDPFKDATTMLEVPTSSATSVSSRKYTVSQILQKIQHIFTTIE